jgi:hypothetical protein
MLVRFDDGPAILSRPPVLRCLLSVALDRRNSGITRQSACCVRTPKWTNLIARSSPCCAPMHAWP